MIPDSYHYLVINLLTIAYPIAQSYERRIRFLSNWRALFSAIAITGGIFLAWDELFAALGVWGFNERYVIGTYFGKLPIEEYGFFLTVPFACLFIYEVIGYYFRTEVFNKFRLGFSFFFFLTSTILAVYYYPRIYTSTALLLVAFLSALDLFIFRFSWYGKFILSYFICLIPFLIMNGWLTGAFTEEPIVWYNDIENMGFRIGTVPLEDAFYLFALLFINTAIYERGKRNPLSARK